MTGSFSKTLEGLAHTYNYQKHIDDIAEGAGWTDRGDFEELVESTLKKGAAEMLENIPQYYQKETLQDALTIVRREMIGAVRNIIHSEDTGIRLYKYILGAIKNPSQMKTLHEAIGTKVKNSEGFRKIMKYLNSEEGVGGLENERALQDEKIEATKKNQTIRKNPGLFTKCGRCHPQGSG